MSVFQITDSSFAEISNELMGTSSSKFDELLSNIQWDNTHIIMIGLHNAGKSTIMSSMKFNCRIKKLPILGKPIWTVKSGKNVRITAWDVGGSGKIRRIWEHYYAVAKGIVFVVDSSDKEALPEAAEKLNLILTKKNLVGVPLVVMANKQDLPETMLIPEISAGLNLCDMDSMWDIVGTSGVTGEGVYEAMQGLLDMMKIHRREIK